MLFLIRYNHVYLNAKITDTTRWTRNKKNATVYKTKESAKVAARNTGGQVISAPAA